MNGLLIFCMSRRKREAFAVSGCIKSAHDHASVEGMVYSLGGRILGLGTSFIPEGTMCDLFKIDVIFFPGRKRYQGYCIKKKCLLEKVAYPLALHGYTPLRHLPSLPVSEHLNMPHHQLGHSVRILCSF